MKPLASLSSTLLARKGQAKPAMRSQAFAAAEPQPHLHAVPPPDDLGWNDMGQEAAAEPVVVEAPLVLAERETLRERIELRPVSTATAARIGRESAAQTRRGKAAFTLRLDADRHLRLRLASAVADRSAQALVAEALDQLLLSMPEVETLVSQLPPPKLRRSAKG